MRILRIDETLSLCETHLSSNDAYGTEIESLLTQSLLVVMYAEFENKIKSILRDKCLSIKDEALKEFFESCVSIVARNIKTSDISGLLGRFGPAYKDKFRKKLISNKSVESNYSSILNNRHRVAHGDGTIASFRDVKNFYEKGHVLLDFFQESLLGNK